ncbi:MAG: hypothetical protein A2516_08480 [Alphaproteobacteria bacterium RIFOXYD12_FULL_60_8]|nr:MAG: hypothetical protein A2516_08480 [Alphaproteobacteria bacterium RIFOXYD12_FULL_60_8]
MARRQRSVVEDLADLPWWISAALGLVLIGIGGSARAGSPLKFAYALSMICWAAAALSFGRSWWQDRLLAKQTSVASLADLSWGGFEEMLAAAFRLEGYSVKVTGDSGADGGVDLVLHRGDEVTLVQAKHWRRDVGVTIVRELFGVMSARKAQRGIIVTSGNFSADAKNFAATLPMELLDGQALLERIGIKPHRAEEARSSGPSCPSCRSSMVARTARQGAKAGAQFFGCSRFPACRTTLPMTG